MSFPMKPNNPQNQKERNTYENANYPEFSEVHNYPDPYRHVGERINTNPNKYKKYDKPKEKKQQYPKMPQKRNPVKKVPVPVTKYVAVPVGAPMLVPVVTEKMVPVYPRNPVYPYPPPQYGPYNYNYPPPPNSYGNTVYVIPPGYEWDYSRRGLVGQLVDDFMNIL